MIFLGKNIELILAFACIAIIICIAATSCTDAKRSSFGGLGSEHKVELYSGGNKVREWTSTGKVLSESGSDGYYFRDKKTGANVEVSGDVVITRKND